MRATTSDFTSECCCGSGICIGCAKSEALARVSCHHKLTHFLKTEIWRFAAPIGLSGAYCAEQAGDWLGIGKIPMSSSRNNPIAEAIMRQLAWLDFYRGKRRLMTGSPQDPIRKWTDRETALSDLGGEGWTISWPYPERLSAAQGLKQVLYGYGTAGTVH